MASKDWFETDDSDDVWANLKARMDELDATDPIVKDGYPIGGGAPRSTMIDGAQEIGGMGGTTASMRHDNDDAGKRADLAWFVVTLCADIILFVTIIVNT